MSSRWNGLRPLVLAIPVYDGDGVRPFDGMPFGEECKDHWVFTASSKQAPVNLPQQPEYGQPMQQANLQKPVHINPITGAPIRGGVRGI